MPSSPTPLPTPTPDPWSAPPPAYGTHLPGAVLPLDLRAPGGGPVRVRHRDVRLLHAALTHGLNRPHHTTRPDFSLIPTAATASGWAIYFADEPVARACAGIETEVRIGHLGAVAAVGPLSRLRAPAVSRPGRHRVLLSAETPVVIRQTGGRAVGHNDAKVTHSAPTMHSIRASLEGLAQRLGVPLRAEDVALVLRATSTTSQAIPIGHLNGSGNVGGWTGQVWLDTSPLGRWLLGCAERLGLGGRTAFGFGRIRVEDQPSEARCPGKPYPADGVADDLASAQALTNFAKHRVIRLGHALKALLAAHQAARFLRIADNGAWLWQDGDLVIVAQRDVLGRQRVAGVCPAERAEDAPNDGSGARGKFFITSYAVDRFIERVIPGLSRPAAMEKLIAITARARAISPYRGEVLGAMPEATLWRTPKEPGVPEPATSRLRFVTSHAPGERLPRLVTVLPRHHEHGYEPNGR